jgi:hypothetical protein
MAPDNDGPEDPHFPVVHYGPGQKRYRDVVLISDLRKSTNTTRTHGCLLVAGNNINDYPSGEITEATAYDCSFIQYDSGTGTNQYMFQVNGDADRSAKLNLYNCYIRCEDGFDYQAAIAGAGAADLEWCDTNLDSSRFVTSGNGAYTQRTSGDGYYNQIKISDDNGATMRSVMTAGPNSGSANHPHIEYGTDTDGTVTFAETWAAAPIVIPIPLTPNDSSTSTWSAWIKTRTTTGFTYEVRLNEDGSISDETNGVTVMWIAIEDL